MNNRFRLAIVGCGDIAGSIALVSKTLKNFIISACASKDLAEAKAFAKRHGIPKAFSDYQELLAHSDDFDAIYLSTPHHLHGAMVKAAIELQIPVLCEKPIAENLSIAQDLVITTSNSEVKVGINYQYRYNPACQKLIHYTQNDIGELYYIRINIPWHREISYFDHSSWHKKIAYAGGGTLLTQGSHFLDIALLASNSYPISAFGDIDRKVFNQPDIEIEDYAHGLVKMENGANIEITSSMVANPQQTGTIEVYGSKGSAKFSATKPPFFSTKGIKPSAPRKLWSLKVHPIARSLHGFKNWIQSDVPFLTPIQSALPVMAAIDAIYRSAKSHQMEKIALDD